MSLIFLQGVSVDDVVNSGPGLVFITYPEVVLKLPGGPIWAFIFFIMLVVGNFLFFKNLTNLIFFVCLRQEYLFINSLNNYTYKQKT